MVFENDSRVIWGLVFYLSPPSASFRWASDATFSSFIYLLACMDKYCLLQGSHPTWKTLKTWILSFSFPGMENAWNLLKKLYKKKCNLNSKPGKKT